MQPKLNFETDRLFTRDKANVSIFVKDGKGKGLCKWLSAFLKVNSRQNSVQYPVSQCTVISFPAPIIMCYPLMLRGLWYVFSLKIVQLYSGKCIFLLVTNCASFPYGQKQVLLKFLATSSSCLC